MLEPFSLTIQVPCTFGYYGSKIRTYHTSIRPTDIRDLLGHDPRSSRWDRLAPHLLDFYKYLQRKTSTQRRESTRNYIRDRMVPTARVIGAFPNISIGTTKPLKFRPFKEDYPALRYEGVGLLEFLQGEDNIRVLLDGLSRVTGALDLIEDRQFDVVQNFTFGVTIFAPPEGHNLELYELGQLFHDFNFLATPVSSSQAIDLDRSDLHILATRELAARDVIKERGGMEKRSGSLGKKSTALVAQKVLLRFVRGACEGPEYLHTLRRVPGDKARLTNDNFDHMIDEMARFLDEIADRMGDYRFEDRESLHLAAPGWNALGVIFHDMHIRLDGRFTGFEEGTIYDRIAAIDWSRYNADWTDSLELGEAETTESGDRRLGRMYGGYRAITKLVDYVRSKTGLDSHLKSLEQEEERARSPLQPAGAYTSARRPPRVESSSPPVVPSNVLTPREGDQQCPIRLAL